MLTFYDAKGLPSITPTEIHRSTVAKCIWLQILYDGKVLSLHTSGALQLWKVNFTLLLSLSSLARSLPLSILIM